MRAHEDASTDFADLFFCCVFDCNGKIYVDHPHLWKIRQKFQSFKTCAKPGVSLVHKLYYITRYVRFIVILTTKLLGIRKVTPTCPEASSNSPTIV